MNRRAQNSELASEHRKELIAVVLRNSAHANLTNETCNLLAAAIHSKVVQPLEKQFAELNDAVANYLPEGML